MIGWVSGVVPGSGLLLIVPRVLACLDELTQASSYSVVALVIGHR